MGTLVKAIYTVGFWIRETGQAIDRLGCRLKGKYYFQEQLSRHRTLMNVYDKAPKVDKDAFVAPSASVIGNVNVGHASSIWYGCVLRGDVNSISIGSGTNIQDNSLVHVAKTNLAGKVLPTIIGNNVTVGHSTVLHGCTVEDEAFVGMGATMEAQFFRFLKIVGVGFKARAESEGRLLFLKLGYSHEVELTVPPAVRVFCFKQNVVCCTGIDKQRVHQFAAAVRNCKPPEVYKGKGIMYLDEVVKRKAGKKSK